MKGEIIMIIEEVKEATLYHTDNIILSHPDETGFVSIMSIADNYDGTEETVLVATGAIDTDDLEEWFTKDVRSYSGYEEQTIEEIGIGSVIDAIVSYFGMAEFDQTYQVQPYKEVKEDDLEETIKEFFLG